MATAVDQWMNRIEIRSESSSRIYVVSQRASGEHAGTWACSCPSFKSRRDVENGRVTCKHLRSMGKEGPPATPAAPKSPARRDGSFTDAAYRHYDTKAGYGSPEEWFRQAEEGAFGPGYRSWSRAQREQEHRRAQAEREQRRREREEQHRQRQRTHTRPPRRPSYGSSVAADLRLLELDEMPADARALKAAMRRAAFKTHPDYGGSREAFIAMFAAYERLLRRFAR